MRSYWSVLHTKFYLVDQIKKNEIGGACSIYGAEERCIQGFGGKTWRKSHLEGPSLDGRIIFRWIYRKWNGGHGLDWLGSGEGQVAGSCICGNEPSGSIKCGEFLD
jgi:hypothetical protein